MDLDPASILDRSKLKSQVRRWRLLAALALLFLIGALFAQSGSNSGLGNKKESAPHIARVTIEGFIMDDAKVIRKLEGLAEDASVKAVIVHVNSLGGTVAGGEAYFDAIKYIQKQKPVVTTMGAVATSAGYMVALAGDQLFARRGTLTGSIGVIMQAPNLKELAEKVGVDMFTLRSGELKAQPGPFEDTPENARDQLQGVVTDFFDMFMTMVKENRPVTDADINIISDGRVVTGRQAIDLHLVDAIGGEREAAAWLVAERGLSDKLKVLEKKDEPRFLEILQEISEGKASLNALDFTHFFHIPVLSYWQKGATLTQY